MEKDPDTRYQSAADFATDLQSAATAIDLDLGAGVSFSYLADKPTPLPTVISKSAAAGAAATVLSAKPPVTAPADKTQVAPSGTLGTRAVAPPVAPPAAEERKSTALPWIILGVVLVIVLIGGGIGGFMILGGGDSEPPPTSAAAVLPENSPEPTNTVPPSPSSEPDATIDIGGTAVAAVAATLTAAPTESPRPTATEIPTETPTPNATATFLAGCEEGLELTNAYTYRNTRSKSAPVGATFPMNLVILNSGTCPVLEGFALAYVGGEDFNQSGPISLGPLASGENKTLTFQLVAPNSAGIYESTWQLETAAGDPFGSPLTFDVTAYVPATATPIPTDTPSVPPTPVRAFGYNWFVINCVYEGKNWSCGLVIEPFGGIGPYSFVSDEDPPADFAGAGPFVHPLLMPRCSGWVHTITVIDEGTGQTFRDALFVDPDNYFEGGCTQE
jgi:hypothetical protein